MARLRARYTSKPENHQIAVYQIVNELVKQIHRFRLDVDDFDRLLSERRQGLMFTDHLNEAMDVMLDVEMSAFNPPFSPKAPASPSKRSRSGVVGSLVSFLTPKRKATPVSPSSTTVKMTNSTSRNTSPLFKTHYQRIADISLDAQPSPPIASGPWSPGKLPPPSPQARPASALSQSVVDSASVSSKETGTTREPKEIGTTKVSLSTVLDNCVILEEFLKEIVSVIMARRALGIDQVDYA